MMLTTAWGQTYTATVTGTVTDPQGSTIAGAKVVAINQGTKLEYAVQTNAAGVYTIPFLPIGSYVLSAEATGFKKLVSSDFKLEVNQIGRINLTMQVGAVSEQVTVTDVAPILQTENVTVGQVITGEKTTSLPLNGRNFQ
ncbi:MAG: carboxypeptidase-like regulatory domain-containing protein, partial [Acidobacteriota bacterium]